MIEITPEPIDHAVVLDFVRSTQTGAICSFFGTVREFTGDRKTIALEYEAYPIMAAKKLAEIAATARERWPIEKLAIVHRVGHLELGEISVAIAVSCPHRAEAFEACRWLIDTLKEVVPIWKKELGENEAEKWGGSDLTPPVDGFSG